MKHLLLATLLCAVPMLAQEGGKSDPDRSVSGGGKFPAGWSARADSGQGDLVDHQQGHVDGPRCRIVKPATYSGGIGYIGCSTT